MLKAGLIQREVAKVRAMREANVARRKEPLIGTSDFPDLAEETAGVLQTAEAPAPIGTTGQTIEPLPRIRLAEPFERLRDASDVYFAKRGARPKVFLACLGRPVELQRAGRIRQEPVRVGRHRGHGA